MSRAADGLAAEIEAAAARVWNIRPLSRTEPHAFAEDKDAAVRQILKLAAEVRNTFGGQAGQFRRGDIIVIDRGRSRRVLVETRRRAA